MTGRRFGRLLVLHYIENRMWACQCDCGTLTSVHGGQLRRGTTFSCGCYRAEGDHGHAKDNARTAEYEAWQNMLARCGRPNHPNYEYYGGRGIAVCDEWRSSYEAFLADMGPRPSSKHTLERLDNSRGYSKENCSWESRQAQANNTRHSKIITIGDTSKTLAQWARFWNVPYQKLRHIIRKMERENVH